MTKKFWELKEEAEKRWKGQFIARKNTNSLPKVHAIANEQYTL
jgi:hypothetical protein